MKNNFESFVKAIKLILFFKLSQAQTLATLFNINCVSIPPELWTSSWFTIIDLEYSLSPINIDSPPEYFAFFTSSDSS